MTNRRTAWLTAILTSVLAIGASAQRGRGGAPGSQGTPTPPGPPRVEELKKEVAADVETMKVTTQQMVDQVFSFGELGFQEFETSKYLTAILEKNGFKIERGFAGIPTAWVATWGTGKPVIALGSDIDDIPQASQKPGVAEELVGAKMYFIRAGMFRDVDISIFAHVGANLGVSWGAGFGTGLQSIEYTFKGESAHAAAQPWRGRSALDGVELLDVGWNFRREHLRLQQRSHNVIVNGGDQPNVVPPNASVWYYFRETDYPHIKELREIGDRIAKAAAMMTDTEVSMRILGAAWPQHMNKTVAETMAANILAVGLPKWDDADIALAKGIQKELKQPQIGLATQLGGLRGGLDPEQNMGGPSDDIGDVSWNVPTVTLSYPANIPNLPGHNWANAIAMATPIAHKGVTAGAKVQAMTVIDMLMRPELVQQAWDYFKNVQTKDQKYIPFINDKDQPALWLNEKIMQKYGPEMKKFYYDPTKYKTYLEQLGIKYPTVR
jgi:aminobenzoyl-glutamate utilization protein B